MAKNSKKITPEDIIKEHLPHIQKLTRELRSLIKKTIPEATEKAYPVWHGIGYRHPNAGYFCGIFPAKDVIKLGFELGVLLPNENGLLSGTGKQVRYLEIKKKSDIKIKPLKKLLRISIKLKLAK